MRMIIGLVLAVTTVSTALSADLRYGLEEADRVAFADEVVTYAPRRALAARRTGCVKCPGSRLHLGGLRTTYQTQLPLGGLGRYCPPELQTRQVVLVRKG
jgi:hypothetical protein